MPASASVFTPPPLLVSVKQACRILSVGETRMYELLGTNAIRSCNLGRSRLIEYASLKQFVKTQLENSNGSEAANV